MASPKQSDLSRTLNLYVGILALCSAVFVYLSVKELIRQVPEYQTQWVLLVALTVVSGLLPVRLPTINATISVSETFIIAGTLLFGRSGGTVLVLFDGLFISIRLLFAMGLRWQQVVFNLSSLPLSIWVASTVAGIQPQFGIEGSLDLNFVLQLALFTTVYCFLNTWLLSFALAMQRHASPVEIWVGSFKELLVPYASGGSIAALLVYNTREVKPAFVFAIVPLLIVLFLSYRWSNKRIEVERDRNIALNRVFLSTIEALALAIDAKDQVTHGHIRRVQRCTMALADELGVKDERQLDAMRAGALLHDTGKLAVPEYILNKPGPLTAAEFERMKLHATVGADILKSIDFPYPVEPIVRHHHENWNGTGYPAGISGQEIPLGARILSVVDCYDALTSDRPYRPRYSRQHAEQVLRERAGTWYDPWVVDGFLRILDELERLDAEDQQSNSMSEGGATLPPAQLDVIVATTAEEREFSELRRELPLAADAAAATEVMFRHLRRVIPLANLTVFMPCHETNDLAAVASFGVGTSALEGLHIGTGERVSGWVIAHKQPVVNSNAALELGPVARTFQTPLRYALAVPAMRGSEVAIGVVTCYGSDPFEVDHRRILESAATLFAASLNSSSNSSAKSQPEPAEPASTRIH